MNRQSVLFAAPLRIEIRESEVPAPEENEVLVRTRFSAISAGTELRLYRGDVPEGAVLDETLPALEGRFRYPVSYGYAAVGEVEGAGRGVFAFQPHTSHFTALEDELYEVPGGLELEAATLWPAFETAVNLVLDGRPLVGERVLVIGQGVVGLATTRLLARFPLERLWTADPIERRRELSVELGAGRSVRPEEIGERADFDLTFELSGKADGLDLASAATGFEGRVVVGSWYGETPSAVRLGTHFHRARLRLIGSQVSHMGPQVASRWSKKRRMQVAGRLLAETPVEELITHRFPVERASEAYELLDRHPEGCLQVLLAYT